MYFSAISLQEMSTQPTVPATTLMEWQGRQSLPAHCRSAVLPVVRSPLCQMQSDVAGADPGFDKGGFDIVPKSDTGDATHNYL